MTVRGILVDTQKISISFHFIIIGVMTFFVSPTSYKTMDVSFPFLLARPRYSSPKPYISVASNLSFSYFFMIREIR